MQKHSEDLTLKKIAVIRTDFPEKFGLPRQSAWQRPEARLFLNRNIVQRIHCVDWKITVICGCSGDFRK